MSENAMVVVDTRQEVDLGTLHASSAPALVQAASAMASTLADVIERQRLFNNISGRKHVRVEGWTTLATMLGCTPREVSNEAQEDGSYVATVELVRMRDGAVISRATSECGMDEPTWAGRARYARRSMAATRATGKTCRLAFSWIMTLAGYDATPAEEIPHDECDSGGDLARHVPPKAAAADASRLASEKQRKMIFAKTLAKADALGVPHETAVDRLKVVCADMGFDSRTKITAAAVDGIVRAVEAWTLETFGAGEPPEEKMESGDGF
jgi:hypothetical protein